MNAFFIKLRILDIKIHYTYVNVYFIYYKVYKVNRLNTKLLVSSIYMATYKIYCYEIIKPMYGN